MKSLRTPKDRFVIILILGALATISPMAIDMYLPAFPQIAADLGTSVAKVSFSVSIYFIGLALGQVFYGPFLDRFGRKRPLYIGLLIYIFASIGCASSRTVERLLFFRFLQSIGGCAASVASTTMVRDFFRPEENAKVFSLIILILGVSPLMAPTIGGVVVSAWGWQSVFYILAGIVGVILSITWFFLPEGNKPDRGISLKPFPIFRSFQKIIENPQFCVNSLAGSFSFAGLFVYVAGSPAIFMDGYHVEAKTYGGIFAFLSIGFIGSSQLNLVLSKRFSSVQILQGILVLQMITGAVFLAGVLTTGYSLGATLAFLFILLSCAGMSYPNAAALALAPFSKNAGSASALLGLIQMGLGAFLSAGVGLSDYKGSLPTALVMTVSSFVGLIIFTFGKKKFTQSTHIERNATQE